MQDFNTGMPIDLTQMPLNPGQPTRIPDYFLFNVGIVKVVPVDFEPGKALRFGLHIDNLFDVHYYPSAQTNSNSSASSTGEDVYVNTGEPRAVYASVGIYF